jgi:hypothetical protein
VQIVLARVFGVPFLSTTPLRAEGMAANPNAFAFQILLAFTALIASPDFRTRGSRGGLMVAVTAIIMAGFWMAGSRAGVGALAALVAAIGLLYWREFSPTLVGLRVAISVALAVALLSFPTLMRNILDMALPTWVTSSSEGGGVLTTIGLAITSSEVQADRMESLRGGLAMWLAHPVFGGGLGAYIYEHLKQTGIPLVIHNSLLWAGAELGLVGVIAYMVPIVFVVRALFMERTWTDSTSKIVVVGSLVTMVTMSMAHDMLYQRLFWLLLGAALAVPYGATVARSPDRS